MKDLEGGFGVEKKCVTGIFLWCFGFFEGNLEWIYQIYFFHADYKRKKQILFLRSATAD